MLNIEPTLRKTGLNSENGKSSKVTNPQNFDLERNNLWNNKNLVITDTTIFFPLWILDSRGNNMMLMNVWETKTSKSYYNFDKMTLSSWAKKSNRKIKNLHVWYDWNPERRPPRSRALWEKVARISDWSAIFANT